MTRLRPDEREERALELQAKIGKPPIETLRSHWKRASLPLRVALFIFALGAVGTFAGVLRLLPFLGYAITVVIAGVWIVIVTRERAAIREKLWPFILVWLPVVFAAAIATAKGSAAGLSTLVASTALAEILILKECLYRFGVEESLYVAGGVTGIILIGGGSKEGLLLIGAVIFAAGVRTASSLAIPLGVILLGAYVSARAEATVGGGYLLLGASLLALFLIRKIYERPSTHDAIACSLVILPPVAFPFFVEMTGESARFIGHLDLPPFLLLISFSAVALTVGIRERIRAALWGGTLLVLFLAGDALTASELRPEFQLILGGALAIAVALSTGRALRSAPRGITANRLQSMRSFQWLELAAASGSASLGAAQAADDSGFEPRRGDYGGGGASGEY